MTPEQARRITVIDDNREFLDLVTEFLTDSGHCVDGYAGDDLDIERLARSEPELIILDLRLQPGPRQLSGWEFLLLARSHAALRCVPIIVCSADMQEMERRRDELRGISGTHLLPKPFELVELEETVARALEREAAVSNGA